MLFEFNNPKRWKMDGYMDVGMVWVWVPGERLRYLLPRSSVTPRTPTSLLQNSITEAVKQVDLDSLLCVLCCEWYLIFVTWNPPHYSGRCLPYFFLFSINPVNPFSSRNILLFHSNRIGSIHLSLRVWTWRTVWREEEKKSTRVVPRILPKRKIEKKKKWFGLPSLVPFIF